MKKVLYNNNIKLRKGSIKLWANTKEHINKLMN